MGYLWLKLFHILLAVIAVGFGASYGLIIARGMHAGRTELTFALRTVQLMDRIGTVAFILLFITGIGLAQMSGFPMSDTWIRWSVVLWFVVLALGTGVQRPTVRRAIAALEARGPEDPEFQKLAARSRVLGAVLGS